MENKNQDEEVSKNLIFEVIFKLNSREYKFKLATKRTWIITVVLLTLRVVIKLI